MAVKFIVLGFGFMGQTHAGNILKHPAGSNSLSRQEITTENTENQA